MKVKQKAKKAAGISVERDLAGKLMMVGGIADGMEVLVRTSAYGSTKIERMGEAEYGLSLMRRAADGTPSTALMLEINLTLDHVMKLCAPMIDAEARKLLAPAPAAK